MSSITIVNPTQGANVSPSFVASGSVEDGTASVEVTLESSVGTVAPVSHQVTPLAGTWTSAFSVNANNYPGVSKLTAAIDDAQVSVTFQIVDV